VVVQQWPVGGVSGQTGNREDLHRSNSVELVYPQVRYLDPLGEEIAKVVEGEIARERSLASDAPFFAAVKQLRPGEVYLSPLGARMTYAIPVYQTRTTDRSRPFWAWWSSTSSARSGSFSGPPL
jgi:hypothetical protein